MFNNVCILDYQLGFELQRSYFLRDCLKEEISYVLKDENLIIYKKNDNGISEEISLDELIFYIHTDVAYKIKEHVLNRGPTTQLNFYRLFKDIDSIKKAVENMKIILKYDDFNGNDCENMKKILIYNCNGSNDCDEKDESKSEYDIKNTDNKSLAF